MYVDREGKSLADYPRPSVAVDTAVLTIHDDALSVALVSAAPDSQSGTTQAARRLPGTFLHEGETLAMAVERSLADKAGIKGLVPEQLQVFDSLGRDSRGWVLSVAHMIAVPRSRLKRVDVEPVETARGLAFDHDQIVELAVVRLREQYRDTPDPARFLGPEFTLFDLERVHRAIDPGTALRDSFRRAMIRRLTETGEMSAGTVGKPARLFRRRHRR